MTSMTDRTSHTHPGLTVRAATNTTSCSTVSIYFMQEPNTEMETPKHKTLNNTLVPTNEVLSTTWKLSVNHTPSHITERHQDSKTILTQGSKLEKQHIRKTLGTLSWVYKLSDYPIEATTTLENQHDQSRKSPQLINKFIYFNSQLDILQDTKTTRTTRRNSHHKNQ